MTRKKITLVNINSNNTDVGVYLGRTLLGCADSAAGECVDKVKDLASNLSQELDVAINEIGVARGKCWDWDVIRNLLIEESLI